MLVNASSNVPQSHVSLDMKWNSSCDCVNPASFVTVATNRIFRVLKKSVQLLWKSRQSPWFVPLLLFNIRCTLSSCMLLVGIVRRHWRAAERLLWSPRFHKAHERCVALLAGNATSCSDSTQSLGENVVRFSQACDFFVSFHANHSHTNCISQHIVLVKLSRQLSKSDGNEGCGCFLHFNFLLQLYWTTQSLCCGGQMIIF